MFFVHKVYTVSNNMSITCTNASNHECGACHQNKECLPIYLICAGSNCFQADYDICFDCQDIEIQCKTHNKYYSVDMGYICFDCKETDIGCPQCHKYYCFNCKNQCNSCGAVYCPCNNIKLIKCSANDCYTRDRLYICASCTKFCTCINKLCRDCGNTQRCIECYGSLICNNCSDNGMSVACNGCNKRICSNCTKSVTNVQYCHHCRNQLNCK